MPHPDIPLSRLIAHRGLSARAPENTLIAVREAKQAGCDWVELDVQLLGDGTPVIWHDANIRRCSDGRGRLGDLDLATARRLDAGGWFGDAFRGERMATLEEMLVLLDELKMGVNLELKVNRGRDPHALVDTALPEVMETLPPARRLVSSFSDTALARARTLAGPESLALGVLFETIGRDWRSRCEPVQAYSVHADWRRLKKTRVREVIEAGYRLLCYTANDPTAFAPRWQWGVEAVISDDPMRFAGHLPAT
ncbi:glycerophosphodiester phosphodiesterase family protein [Halomonas daqiaonensis]|uniref:Glycerophosphoryl diester phosphodiesterase n=1 Tax=Halomonas daqiaonensis TaxID=650850 RepID=A0A1H7I5D7_9GAMM|nr:glycerophosphodiester phosphodiesterase family protein [Halomonas daqiaonensis]SEK56680.1 glycerophosphoryl diester phosphodiesterase [Halomonas daqiaonensis]